MGQLQRRYPLTGHERSQQEQEQEQEPQVVFASFQGRRRSEGGRGERGGKGGESTLYLSVSVLLQTNRTRARSSNK